MRVRAAAPAHFDWIRERAGCVLTPDAKAIEAVDDRGRIVAMVAFDRWTPNSLSMDVALEHPAALRHILRPAFDYAFIQCGKRIVLATIIASNRRSCRLVESLGFTEVHRIVDGWKEGDDVVLYSMRFGECRWLSPLRRVA